MSRQLSRWYDLLRRKPRNRIFTKRNEICSSRCEHDVTKIDSALRLFNFEVDEVNNLIVCLVTANTQSAIYSSVQQSHNIQLRSLK